MLALMIGHQEWLLKALNHPKRDLKHERVRYQLYTSKELQRVHKLELLWPPLDSSSLSLPSYVPKSPKTTTKALDLYTND